MVGLKDVLTEMNYNREDHLYLLDLLFSDEDKTKLRARHQHRSRALGESVGSSSATGYTFVDSGIGMRRSVEFAWSEAGRSNTLGGFKRLYGLVSSALSIFSPKSL